MPREVVGKIKLMVPQLLSGENGASILFVLNWDSSSSLGLIDS